MKRNVTMLLAGIAFMANLLNQYADLFADFPNFHKFLPILTAAAIGLVAIVQANYNPDGTKAGTPYIPGEDNSTFRSFTIFGLIFILSTSLMGATCSSSSSYKKAAQACYDLSVGITATVQVTKSLHDQKLIADNDYMAILEVERTVILSNEEFRKQLVSAGEINTTNKFAFLALIDNLTTSLEQLQSTGTLHIKNPNSAATFSAALTTIRTALTVLRGFITQVKSPVTIPANLKTELNLQFKSIPSYYSGTTFVEVN